MFDGSNLSLQENLDISAKLLERFVKNDLVLEIETGAVGGEEDDVVGDHAAKLYTTPEDTLEVARRLNPIGGRYLLAATFGNVHAHSSFIPIAPSFVEGMAMSKRGVLFV